MQRLRAGAVAKLSRKLHLAVGQEVLVRNETGLDVELEQEENCDGSRPRLILIIKKVLRRKD